MKIDYTNFLTNKPRLTDGRKIAAAYNGILSDIRALDLKGTLKIDYFLDNAAVYLDGAFYGMWNYENRCFFAGSVGDYRPLSERGIHYAK